MLGHWPRLHHFQLPLLVELKGTHFLDDPVRFLEFLHGAQAGHTLTDGQQLREQVDLLLEDVLVVLEDLIHDEVDDRDVT